MQAAGKWRVVVPMLLAALGLAACAAWPGAKREYRPTTWPLASPVAGTPAGACAEQAGPTVTITIRPDTLDPRCVRVTAAQRLVVDNQTGGTLRAGIALFAANVPAGQTHSFDTPFGEYLAPGIHSLSVEGRPAGAEVWLVSPPGAVETASARPTLTRPAPAATATIESVPTIPPPTPTEARPAEQTGGLAAGSQALYGMGPETGPTLYTWSRQQGERALDLTVFPGAVASRSGRWVATPATYPEATAVWVYDLAAGTQVEVAASPGYAVYRLAFDPAESRLAFLELGPPGAEDTPWAIVVARLADGAVTRLQGSTVLEAGRLPGNPLGWTAAGHELLLSLFIPYSEGLYMGVVAVALPPGTPDGFISGLVPRPMLVEGQYMSTLRLSPDSAQLLYLGRDPGYMPADYEPVMADWAVNELWTLDLAAGERTMWYQATNGDALLRDAAWSPDGTQILFAQGHYAGWNLSALTLKIWDAPSRVRDVASVPVEENAWLSGLYWCAPQTALAEFSGPAPLPRLWAVDLAGNAGWWQPRGGEAAFMVGCVAPRAR